MPEEEKLIKLNIDDLEVNSTTKRKYTNEKELQELASSIKEYGIISPLIVTKHDNKYIIISGERRYQAAKLIGLKELPVIIKQIPLEEIPKITIAENIHRSSYTPIEEATAYKELIKSMNDDSNLLSQKINKNQTLIENKLKLLTLPEDIQTAIGNKQISENHGKILSQVTDEEKRKELLQKTITDKLTVKDLNIIVNPNEISEKELQSAMNDIMKSLNIKEEKESDKMNNGNFFPNFNNQGDTNTNVSLNSMNEQSMNMQPMPQANEMVMPTPQYQDQNQFVQPMPTTVDVPSMEPQQNLNMNPMQYQEQPVNPQPTPIVQTEPVAPIQDFTQSQPLPEQPNLTPDMPILEVPQQQPTEIPVVNSEPVQNNIEQPLFDNSVNMNEQPIVEMPDQSGILEVPTVESQPTIIPLEQPSEQPIPVPEDNLAKTINLLTQNGINYKLYSNETGHCIIIEL